MKSLDIYLAKETIKKFIRDQEIPKEVARMMLKEIYEEVQREALEEIKQESMERGNIEDGN